VMRTRLIAGKVSANMTLADKLQDFVNRFRRMRTIFVSAHCNGKYPREKRPECVCPFVCGKLSQSTIAILPTKEYRLRIFYGITVAITCAFDGVQNILF